MVRRGLVLIVLLSLQSAMHAEKVVTLWHSYRGGERAALEKVAELFNASQIGKADAIRVELLMVPYDAYADKLRITITAAARKTDKNLRGPDVFIAAHTGVGSMIQQGLILPIESYIDPKLTNEYFRNTIVAFNLLYPDALWALPGSFKNIALFYNRHFIENPPKLLSEILTVAGRFQKSDPSRRGLMYETGNFYHHAMWFHAWGGSYFRELGRSIDGVPVVLPLIYSEPMIRSSEFVRDRIRSGDFSGGSESEMLAGFNDNKTMFIISGQWTRGEINLQKAPYGVVPLPIVDELNRQAAPFLTIEGYFLSACARDHKAAMEVIRYFTCAAMVRYFSKIGGQTPANKLAYEYSEVKNDPISTLFMREAGKAFAMPNCPEMGAMWGAGTSGLARTFAGEKARDVWKSEQTALMLAIESNRHIRYKDYGFPVGRLDKPFPPEK